MKNFFLTIFFLLVLLPLSGRAETTSAVPLYKVYILNFYDSGWLTSAASACGGYVNKLNSNPADTCNDSMAGATSTVCSFIQHTLLLDQTCSNTSNVVSSQTILNSFGCPDSSWSFDGSTCFRADCPAGTVRLSDGTCGRDCNALTGTAYSGYIPSTANPASVCQDGCSASVQNASNQASVDGQQVIAGTFTYSGGSCSGNDITGGTPPACPSGQCVGQINGANSCFSCADVSKSATEYTKTSDSTIKTTTYNSDGSTTTTVTDTGTGTTSSPSVVQKTDQQSFCEQNPKSLTCLEIDSPNISEPVLENVTSGTSNFQTIKDLLKIQPSNFSHTSKCPVTYFDWNDRSFVVNAHCQLVEDHFTLLSAVMLAAWAVLSLFVVLRA